MSLKIELLQALADGKFHSGDDLGSAMNLTRSAVWKHIQRLPDIGIEVRRVKGRGYQIPHGLDLINKEKVLELLPATIRKQLHLETFFELNSTNQYLWDHLNSLPTNSAVIAEYQSAGRGRMQKKWLAPFGSSLCLSFLWKSMQDSSQLAGLSLATGVAMVFALERYGVHNLQLKWPNDLLWNQKKLGGILIELSAETHGKTQAIIGVGLNVCLPSNFQIDQDWIDLAHILHLKPQRNVLAAIIIEELATMLTRFEQDGFKAFKKHWEALDAYFNQPIVVSTPQNQFYGIAKGISERAELIIRDEQAKERRFNHGEVSLRLA